MNLRQYLAKLLGGPLGSQVGVSVFSATSQGAPDSAPTGIPQRGQNVEQFAVTGPKYTPALNWSERHSWPTLPRRLEVVCSGFRPGTGFRSAALLEIGESTSRGDRSCASESRRRYSCEAGRRATAGRPFPISCPPRHFGRIWTADAGTSRYRRSFGSMPNRPRDYIGQTNEPRARLLSSVPALRLGSIQLRALLSRRLEKANDLLDEWDREYRRPPRHNDSAASRSRSG